MNRYEYFIGLNDANGHPLDRIPFRLGELKRMISKIFRSGTILQTEGVWEGSTEPGLQVIVVSSLASSKAREVAALFAEIFDQSVVMLNESHVISGLYFPPPEGKAPGAYVGDAELDELANDGEVIPNPFGD